MSGLKVSNMPLLSQSDLAAATDYVPIVDPSEPVLVDRNKRILAASLVFGSLASAEVEVDATGLRITGVTVGRGGGAVGTNTTVGAQALAANVAGGDLVAVGYQALTANTTGFNTAVGSQALLFTATGAFNTAVGAQALALNVTGLGNTSVGMTSLVNLGSGDNNVAVGYDTLRSATSGSSNTAVGAGALFSAASGTGNVAVGANADALRTTGNNNIAIGTNVETDSPTGSNQINIGGVYFHDRFVFPERADPAAPPAGRAVVFARDNGSGETQLCVRFATGAVQVLATEP
jgi:hypothetical protein